MDINVSKVLLRMKFTGLFNIQYWYYLVLLTKMAIRLGKVTAINLKTRYTFDITISYSNH